MYFNNSDNPTPVFNPAIATAINPTTPHRIGVDTVTKDVIVYCNWLTADLYAIKQQTMA
jgi:hypothetical protein